MYSDIVIKAKKHVNKLLKDLNDDNWYYFHNLHHTFDVFKRATQIAQKEWVNDELIEILQLASLFHDTWFIKQYYNNEEIWAQIAEEWLKQQWYPEDKIDIVKSLIMATVPDCPPPEHKIHQIIKDADLDNLWTPDWLENTDKLRKEILYLEWNDISFEDWLKKVSDFILSCKYYTKTQNEERGEMLEKNKQELKKLIENM